MGYPAVPNGLTAQKGPSMRTTIHNRLKGELKRLDRAVHRLNGIANRTISWNLEQCNRFERHLNDLAVCVNDMADIFQDASVSVPKRMALPYRPDWAPFQFASR
jgi:hypothetical protein